MRVKFDLSKQTLEALWRRSLDERRAPAEQAERLLRLALGLPDEAPASALVIDQTERPDAA